jgi:hypothetical protein
LERIIGKFTHDLFIIGETDQVIKDGWQCKCADHLGCNDDLKQRHLGEQDDHACQDQLEQVDDIKGFTFLITIIQASGDPKKLCERVSSGQ